MKKNFLKRSIVTMLVMVALAATAFAGCNKSADGNQQSKESSLSTPSLAVSEVTSVTENSAQESSNVDSSKETSKAESSVEEKSKEESKTESSVVEKSAAESSVEEKSHEESKAESSIVESSVEASQVESSIQEKSEVESSVEPSKTESSVQESSKEISKIESSVEEKSQEEPSYDFKRVTKDDVIAYGICVKDTPLISESIFNGDIFPKGVYVMITQINDDTYAIYDAQRTAYLDASCVEILPSDFEPDFINDIWFGLD